MKIEIYSLKNNEKDFNNLNEKFKETIGILAQNNFSVIYKTETERNTQKIKKAFAQSLNEAEKPEMIVIANALDSKDASSFKNLFADIIIEAEKQLNPKDKKNESYTKKKIKIYTLGDLGEGYRGYCFTYLGIKVAVLPYCGLTQKDIPSLILNGVQTAKSVFEENEAEFPGGLTTVNYTKEEIKKQKQGFIKSFFPQKEDKKREKARKVTVLLATLAFFVAAGYLLNSLVIGPAKNKQLQSEIQTAFRTEDNNGEGNTSDSGEKKLVKNWNALKKINSDIVGWIKMDNSQIDYPVLEKTSDTSAYQYYLRRDYKGNYDEWGSIFLDYRCKQSVKSRNIIMHGHHMNDGSMFANLLNFGGAARDNYKANLDFYKKAPTLEFDTPEENAAWKIISVFKTNTHDSHGKFFNYMQGTFTSDAQFMNFIYNVRVRSLINIPVDVNENDQIISLSTCSYEFSDFRTVVVARKVRADENYNVDVAKATVNTKAVWPQVYYNNFGGTRPEVTTFKTAYKAGQIDWYDGKDALKIKGDEALTGSDSSPSSSPSGNSSSNNLPVYTVKWINYDGSLIKTEEVQEGKDATPPATPKKPSDDYNNYVFVKWGNENVSYKRVTSNLTIAPVFKAVKK